MADEMMYIFTDATQNYPFSPFCTLQLMVKKNKTLNSMNQPIKIKLKSPKLLGQQIIIKLWGLIISPPCVFLLLSLKLTKHTHTQTLTNTPNTENKMHSFVYNKILSLVLFGYIG